MPESFASALNWLLDQHPFQLLDQIRICIPGLSGEGEYSVRGSEPFLRGHFPGEPMVPGVILVEMVQQLSRCVIASGSQTNVPSRARLSTIRMVKILGTARPHELIRVQARVTTHSKDVMGMSGMISVLDRELLSAEMNFLLL